MLQIIRNRQINLIQEIPAKRLTFPSLRPKGMNSRGWNLRVQSPCADDPELLAAMILQLAAIMLQTSRTLRQVSYQLRCDV